MQDQFRPAISVLVAVFALCGGIVFAGGTAEQTAVPDDAVELRIYVGEFTPRERLPSDRWDPPSYLNTIIEEYQELHPNVRFDILPEIPDGDEFLTWITTQYLAASGPDVGTMLFSEVNRNAHRGWFTNLLPYLEDPNPYVAGNEAWKDIFLQGVLDTGTAPDGNMYVLPTGLVGTAIFYNQDIFDEVGVQPPQTWAQFMSIQQEIKDAGYVPFAFHMSGNPYQANWALRSMQDMLLDDRLGEIKGTGEPIERTTIEAEGVSQKELVAAIRRGDYSALDPQWQEQLRLLNEWSEYWDPSWIAMNVDDAHRSFVRGQSAMMWHSSGRVRMIEADTLRDFDYGTFSFPTITEESSPYATGIPAPAIGGYTGAGAFTVAQRTEERGTREAAVDFLRFLTAPENFVPMHEDLGAYAPGIRGDFEVSPEIRPFLESLARGTFRIESFFRGLTRQYSDEFVRVLQEYLTDRVSLQQASQTIQGLLDQAAEDLIESHNWTDLP